MSLIKKAEKAEIARLRKNYLAKRRRLIKKGIPEYQIPSFPIINPTIPRAQINQIKEEMRAFTRSPAYQYVQVSDSLYLNKRQIRELESVRKKANQMAYKAYQRNLKKTFRPLSERGWPTPGASRTVESEHMKKPPKGFTKPLSSFTSFREYQSYMEHLKNYLSKGIQYYDELYRENTIKALQQVFGKTATKNLVKRIMEMDIDIFIGLMETQDIEIEYLYLPEEDIEDQLEMISQYFDDDAIKNYLS